jgi:hypothetical protein
LEELPHIGHMLMPNEFISFLSYKKGHTEFVAVDSSYPEEADAKLTPDLASSSVKFLPTNAGMLLATPNLSAAWS